MQCYLVRLSNKPSGPLNNINYHVATTKGSEESEVATLDGTDFTSFLITKVRIPNLILGSLEFLLSRPGKFESPSLVAHPVADEVSITSINENAKTIFQK